jgi:acyl-CoA thioesterase FadM
MELTTSAETDPGSAPDQITASGSGPWPVSMLLRWRDYDWAGHVNHISYLDLVLEAMGSAGIADPLAPTPGVTMEFLAPRTVGPEGVVISQVARDKATSGATFTISTEYGREPLLHTSVTLRRAKPAPPAVARPHRYPVAQRQRDVLAGPSVDLTILDWLQESRGALMQDLILGAQRSSVAVVHLEYDRYRAIVASDLDFVVSTGISAIGRSSFRVHSELEGAGSTLSSATAVMVKISLESGRSVALTDSDLALVKAWRDGTPQ